MINQLVFENLKHRPVRTGLSVLAIGISVTLVLTIVGLSHGMLEDNARRARGIGADLWIRPGGMQLGTGGGSAPFNEKLVPAIEKFDHVTLATGTVIYPLQFPQSIQGIDFAKFDKLTGGVRFVKGGIFRKKEDIIIDSEYAEEKKLQVGSRIKLVEREWTVCGIIEPGKLSRIFLPLEVVQDFTGNAGKVSQIFLKVDDPASIAAVKAKLKETFPEYGILTLEEIVSLYSVDAIAPIKIFIRVIVGIAVVIGFAFVFLSMYTAVLERTREIGILKALGASPGYIMGILMRESALLALAGSILGIVFSYGTRELFRILIPASMQQKIMPDWWPIAAAIALGGAFLGTLYPSYRAAKQDAIEALAYE